MTETSPRYDHVSRNIGAAAEAVLEARGDNRKLKRAFEDSPIPMVMVDGGRRYTEVNRSARLWFRVSREEMRAFAIDDLEPAPSPEIIQQAWTRLHASGCVAGRCPVFGRDGSRHEVVYYAIAGIRSGLHLIAFAPANWPEHEFAKVENGGSDSPVSLTPRELELLGLAADGLSGPDLARELFVSPATVRTHFENIHDKLEVRTRAAAVAKAMRLGLIE
jgi:ATP/maltotriose-dependent transcriptional regulator MalT